MFRRALWRGLYWCVVLTVAWLPPAWAQSAQSISGTVVDVSGLAVAGATITARTAAGETTTVTAGADGTFTIQGPVTSLRVDAPGFSTLDLGAPAGDRVRAVLRPASFADSVVVTATRGAERLPSAASATVVTAAELNNTAAGALDDVLRNTPGFSLFRRSSSR